MFENVYVIGDSWASGVNSDTGGDHQGWAQILGIPPERNMAIAGSTAEDWATRYADKIKSIPSGSVVIISLGGNDMIKALSDGRIDPVEAIGIMTAASDVLGLVEGCMPTKVIYSPYCNPYPNRPDARAVIDLYHSGLMLALISIEGNARLNCKIEIPNYELTAEDFSKGDIHPNSSGYAKMAETMKGVL